MSKFIFEALIVSLMIMVIQTEGSMVDQCEDGILFLDCTLKEEGKPDKTGICNCDPPCLQYECRNVEEVCKPPYKEPGSKEGVLMRDAQQEAIRCNTGAECPDPGLGMTKICRKPFTTQQKGYCCKG